MKINIDWKVNPNLELYRRVDINLAYSFTKDCMKEFGKMLKAVVLFGSSARKTKTPESDLDILIVVDDLSMNFTEELTEAYRLVVQKLIVKHSTRIHVTTLRFSSMWEYIRNGDPIAINILRDGIFILAT